MFTGRSHASATPPSSPESSPTSTGANSNTVPSFNAANNPKAGSSPDKYPEANVTALPPPNPDNGAVNAAIISPPAGATPNV